jgi:MinD-like ATPase involved in chromosome partitioning or flagellar assembly
MFIAMASAKGSPGTTTLGLALASVWPRPVVLVEADPDGGDLGARCGLPDRPGLLSLATETRHDGQPVEFGEHEQHVGSVRVVIGPADARQASIAVTQLGETFHSLSDVDLLVDVGRLRPGSASSGLVSLADFLVVVSGGDLASVAHTAPALHAVAAAGVVVVGETGFDTAALREAFGAPVLGYVPRDERAAAALHAGAVRRPSRRGLLAAATTIADRLVRRLTAPAPEGTSGRDDAVAVEQRDSGGLYDDDRDTEPARR